MEGTAFTSSLLFDVSNETLYGFRYMYQSGSSEGTAELMGTLLSKATELYGTPIPTLVCQPAFLRGLPDRTQQWDYGRVV